MLVISSARIEPATVRVHFEDDRGTRPALSAAFMARRRNKSSGRRNFPLQRNDHDIALVNHVRAPRTARSERKKAERTRTRKSRRNIFIDVAIAGSLRCVSLTSVRPLERAKSKTHMGTIPSQNIEQIAAANDIVEVIGSYFPLKRAGSSFKALCPFHQEKTPSFTVSPQRQTFHCFGCGVGGSVFRFVMDYEHLDFPSAVQKLAARAGIPVIEERGASERRRSSARNAAHAAAVARRSGGMVSRESAEARVGRAGARISEETRDRSRRGGETGKSVSRRRVGMRS